MINQPVIGICKLCQKEKELIRRSHIWPSFMYQGMKDEKGRLHVVNSEDPAKSHTVQSGSYESGIFCAECDNVRLGKLERYASNSLYKKPYFLESGEFKTKVVAGGMELIACEQLDYNQFKLFLLSLLWRASISTEAVFVNFKLSVKDEEFLRTGLYDGTVFDESVFPCVLITTEGVDPDENFIAVDPFRPGLVKFYINSFAYTFYLTENKKDEMVMHLAIGMDDKMRIVKVPVAQWNRIRDSIIEATLAPSRKKK